MSVLVIENYPDAPMGNVGRALDQAGVTYDIVQAHAGTPVPETGEGRSGLVVLGGSQNALDDEGYPFLPSVCELIRNFHDQDKPVLGICLGSQLIARAFGAENILDRPIEFGWHEVRAVDTAGDDPIGRILAEGSPIFHWHTDTFSLPKGAAHLASSDATPHQAFRLGRATYATQFHFEVALPEVEMWSELFSERIRDHGPDWPERFAEEANRHAEASDRTGQAIAEAWVALLDQT